MNFVLRLSVAMIVVCGFIPARAGHCGMEKNVARTPSEKCVNTREPLRPPDQALVIAFDADEHIDIPRDNDGHAYVRMSSDRCGGRQSSDLRHAPVAGPGLGHSRDRKKVAGAEAQEPLPRLGER